MHTPVLTDRDQPHRFPAASIRHGVWLSYRRCLSDRDGAELLFARGIIVTNETIRMWCVTVGRQDAHQRRRPQRGDTWPLEEVLLTIPGERHSLWRAVDQDGHGLDRLVQRWRDHKAAKQCFSTFLTGCHAMGPRNGSGCPASNPRRPAL